VLTDMRIMPPLQKIVTAGRRWAVAGVLVMLPAACASGDLDQLGGGDKAGAAITAGQSQSGQYLAGRHAQAERDMKNASRFLSRALEMSPDAENLLRRAFVVMVAEGRIDEAAKLAPRVLAKNPAAPIAGLAIVTADIAADHYEQAAKNIDALPEGGINTYLKPLLGAWAALGQGKTPEQAVDHLSVLSKDSTQALYFLHSAILQDFGGNREKAEQLYLKAIQKQGGASLRVVQLLGNLYERGGEKEKATRLYTDHALASPRSPLASHGLKRLQQGTVPGPIIGSAGDGAAEALLDIATSLSQQNAHETALLLTRLTLHLKPDLSVAKVLLGNILLADNRLLEANELFQSVPPTSPYAWPVRLRIADNLDDLGRTDEAADLLRAMANEEPDSADPLIRLGDILRGHERFTEAAAVYDEAVGRIQTLEKHHWSLLYARGITLERSGQWARAEKDFLKALEFEPDQPFVLNYLGYSWVDNKMNLDRATKMIRKAVELRPNDGYIVDSLGWAYYRLGRFEESVKEMERAVELQPEDAVINDHLGDALWRVGRNNEAYFQWSHVLTLNPDADLLDQVTKKLRDGLPPL